MHSIAGIGCKKEKNIVRFENLILDKINKFSFALKLTRNIMLK